MNDHDIIMEGELALASKIDASREGTPSSLESTPEHEAGPEASQGPTQPQKRKGGRKPIYATSEERKQRNRQAQAAFRERRTEYIKQLEANIKQNEEMLHSLQENHRRINNDCLMLRYKNSLLERILLEKGIDVRTELAMKQGGSSLDTALMHSAPTIASAQQPQLQRTALQRQQVRRSGGPGFLPKLAPGQGTTDVGYASSPHAHPTPSSHASSPSQLSTRSPLAVQQGGMTSPASSALAQPQGQQYQNTPRSSHQQHLNQTYQQGQPQSAQTIQRPPQQSASTPNHHSSASGMSNHSASSHQSYAPPSASNTANGNTVPQQSATAFYPSPFQKHYDQLDQEYDTQQPRSMLDDPEPQAAVSGPSAHQLHGTYPPQYDAHALQQSDDYYQPQGPHQQIISRSQYEQPSGLAPTSHPAASDGHFNIDPNDPMLDQDLFGLSASMHYPTPYSYDQQQGQP